MKNYSSVGEGRQPTGALGLRLPSPVFRTRPSLSGSRQKEQSSEIQLSERGETGEPREQTNVKTVQCNIKSYLRIRPSPGTTPLLQLHLPQNIQYERTRYRFDSIFTAGTPQQEIYSVAGREVVTAFLEGYNATILAYGSTGSGKTYTMFGEDDGLVPSAVREIFLRADPSSRLSCSMVEIYKEGLTDLLAVGGPELKLKEGTGSCVVHNLSSHSVGSVEEALALIKRGNFLKRIRETDLNESSSRSHVVFTVELQRADGARNVCCRLNLVDLAGSEKVCRSKVEGEGLEEAKKINLSLSCLANTISALVRGSEHIPYRESKLTRILKDSLMGNSVTRLIVTCSMAHEALQDTLSSIKFAQRAQRVSTNAQVAYLPQQQQKHRLQAALQRLQGDSASIAFVVGRPCECLNCAEIRQLLRRKPALPLLNLGQPSPKSIYLNTSLRKHNFSSCKQRNNTDSDSLARKMHEVSAENEKLKQQKLRLEAKVKALEDKDRASNGKKVIRLGERSKHNKDHVASLNKENIMSCANTNCLIPEKTTADKTECSAERSKNEVVQMPAQQREQRSREGTQLMQEAITKLEAACCEYRNTIFPLHLDILQKQAQLLKARLPKLSSHSIGSPQSLSADPLQVSGLLISLQKRLCSYVESISDIVPRLLQGSQSEAKSELSEVLRVKLQEVSDIKWSFKEFYSQSQEQSTADLQALSDLLAPLSHRHNLYPLNQFIQQRSQC